MKWTNQGVMSLLSGCILSFRSTPSISNDISDVSVLPAADLNQSFIDSHNLNVILMMSRQLFPVINHTCNQSNLYHKLLF